jgi:hypothetical protein
MSPATIAMKIPVIDSSRDDALLRCAHCSAYLNPFCAVDRQKFTWEWALCKLITPIPSEFSTAESFVDRPELASPLYDVITPRTYARPSSMPLYLFIFDVSAKALELDFTQQMIRTIRSSLSALPACARVGLVTLSDV